MEIYALQRKGILPFSFLKTEVQVPSKRKHCNIARLKNLKNAPGNFLRYILHMIRTIFYFSPSHSWHSLGVDKKNQRHSHTKFHNEVCVRTRLKLTKDRKQS